MTVISTSAGESTPGASARTSARAIAITSAARQVFGMMLDVELQEAVPSSASASQVRTSADVTVHGHYVLVFSLWATVPSLMALSARMLGTRVEEVTEQDYLLALSVRVPSVPASWRLTDYSLITRTCRLGWLICPNR